MITLANCMLSEDRRIILASGVSNDMNGNVSKRLVMVINAMRIVQVSYAIYQDGKRLLTSEECDESLLEIYNAI